MTCCPAQRPANAPKESRGAFCTSPRRRSTSIRRSIFMTPRSTRRPRKSAAHHRRRRARARRDARLLRLPADVARPRRNRLRRGGLAPRLRREPHPQARADDAGQGGRPRAPDRGGRRADRPGNARLSGDAGDRRAARPRRCGKTRHRCHSRRRRAPRALADPGRGDGRGTHAAPSTPYPRSILPTAITGRRRRSVLPRRAPRKTVLFSPCCCRSSK